MPLPLAETLPAARAIFSAPRRTVAWRRTIQLPNIFSGKIILVASFATTMAADQQSTKNIVRLSTCRLLADSLCIALVLTPAVVARHMTPHRRSIDCDDPTIRHPYRKSSVPANPLFSLGYLLVVITIVSLESYNYRWRGDSSSKRSYQMLSSLSVPPIPEWLYSSMRCFACYNFGCFITYSLTQIVKIAVGRLRPHFWAACRPRFLVEHCPHGASVDDYVCTNLDRAAIREARLSFFSGHASFAMFTAVFLAVYLQRRMRERAARYWRQLLQVALFSSAMLVGLSRVSDYKHHASDVIAGSVLGAAIALFVSTLLRRRLAPLARVGSEAGSSSRPRIYEALNDSSSSGEFSDVP